MLEIKVHRKSSQTHDRENYYDVIITDINGLSWDVVRSLSEISSVITKYSNADNVEGTGKFRHPDAPISSDAAELESCLNSLIEQIGDTIWDQEGLLHFLDDKIIVSPMAKLQARDLRQHIHQLQNDILSQSESMCQMQLQIGLMMDAINELRKTAGNLKSSSDPLLDGINKNHSISSDATTSDGRLFHGIIRIGPRTGSAGNMSGLTSLANSFSHTPRHDTPLHSAVAAAAAPSPSMQKNVQQYQ
eukprot:CAMPEP_0175000566 /NCGR_PEP_ID=MMETSP0005-20121125/2661_1 /TAXON_ID=420556 /ORGANISM="Ochromonas sp., Strain CCMP1393" /LENGTH=245 /DNA_ID=CAMNT_0016255379 /DNA_START=94 /DNA_END=828 /DNA_ORIENTATION=+